MKRSATGWYDAVSSVRALVVALISALSNNTWAEEGADPETPVRLDAVVVHAQKREEQLQRVPMHVEVIDSGTLAKMGVTTAADLARATPGLTVLSAGPGQNILSMRGIASSAGTAGTVGYYLDDTPISASSNAALLSVRGLMDPALLDIARTEVLFGPQGTLYGSSSMGGTVKFISRPVDFKRQSMTLGTELAHTTEGGWSRSIQGGINLPLSDSAGIKLSALLRENDGFIDRAGIQTSNYLQIDPAIARQAGVNTEHTEGGRATVRLRSADGTDISASLLHQYTRTGAPFQFDMPPGTLAHPVQTRMVDEPATQYSTIANLTLRKQIGDIDLMSATSWYSRTVNMAEDGSKVLFALINASGQDHIYPTVMNGSYANREWTEEIRARMPLAAGDIIAGVFYHHVDAPLHSVIPVPPGYNETFGTRYDLLFRGARQASVREWATFSEISHPLSDTLRFNLGARAFSIRQSFAQQGDGLFNGGASEVKGDASDHGVTPRAVLSWQINPQQMAYASLSRGYRQGGPNNPAPEAVCGNDVRKLGMSEDALKRFAADTLWSKELGFKGSLLERTLFFNAVLYQMDWQDVQQQIVLPCGFNITANFGSARSRGAEISLIWQPDRAWETRVSVSHTDARLENDVLGTSAQAGDNLLNVPHWTAAWWAEHRFAWRGDSTYVRLDYTFTGSADTLYEHQSLFRRRAGFGVFNVRTGQVARQGRIGWSMFIENLTNKMGQTDLPVAIFADLNDTRRIAINRPRTIGLNVDFAF
ncbi:TonB-dependent receptor [Burkholderiaceae bacterium DAT-1]|nr:TonB-dependent receptor [Burkholderiaceae bacterium DAT-1]